VLDDMRATAEELVIAMIEDGSIREAMPLAERIIRTLPEGSSHAQRIVGCMLACIALDVVQPAEIRLGKRLGTMVALLHQAGALSVSPGK
jgi:hypothetical protein